MMYQYKCEQFLHVTSSLGFSKFYIFFLTMASLSVLVTFCIIVPVYFRGVLCIIKYDCGTVNHDQPVLWS